MWISWCWTRVFWIGLILTLCVVLCTASVPRPSPSTPSPATKTAREFVLSGECAKSVTFGEGFRFHFPMGADGKPLADKMYSTGVVRFVFDKDAEGCRYEVVDQEIKEQ